MGFRYAKLGHSRPRLLDCLFFVLLCLIRLGRLLGFSGLFFFLRLGFFLRLFCLFGLGFIFLLLLLGLFSLYICLLAGIDFCLFCGSDTVGNGLTPYFFLLLLLYKQFSFFVGREADGLLYLIDRSLLAQPRGIGAVYHRSDARQGLQRRD